MIQPKIIKTTNEIAGFYKLPENQQNIIIKCLFEKTDKINIKKEKEKSVYNISKTLVNPRKRPDLFRDFIDYIEINIPESKTQILQAGLSIKIISGTISKNLLSIRHPRFKNGEIYCNICFNALTDQIEAENLDISFTLQKHENYYKIMGIKLTEIPDLLDQKLIYKLLIIAKRSLKKIN